jgi:hypothetical protein
MRTKKQIVDTDLKRQAWVMQSPWTHTADTIARAKSMISHKFHLCFLSNHAILRVAIHRPSRQPRQTTPPLINAHAHTRLRASTGATMQSRGRGRRRARVRCSRVAIQIRYDRAYSSAGAARGARTTQRRADTGRRLVRTDARERCPAWVQRRVLVL